MVRRDDNKRAGRRNRLDDPRPPASAPLGTATVVVAAGDLHLDGRRVDILPAVWISPDALEACFVRYPSPSGQAVGPAAVGLGPGGPAGAGCHPRDR